MSKSSDDEKIENLILHIAKLIPAEDLGMVKLQKILFASDATYFADHGATITKATYVKGDHGPYCAKFERIIRTMKRAGKIVEREIKQGAYGLRALIAIEQPDYDNIPNDQLILVSDVARNIGFRHTATSASQASHGPIWEAARKGEALPFAGALFSKIPPTPVEIIERALATMKDEDWNWVKNQMAQ